MKPDRIRFLLDQNIPYEVTAWLRSTSNEFEVDHVQDLGLSRSTDADIFQHAQSAGAIIVTYDEDFADQRLFPVAQHCGVIRLRVEPTTDEITIEALQRLLSEYSANQLAGKLVVIDDWRIRVIQPPG